MHYGTIKNCDIANGIGTRVTIFVSGCTNCCKGCFQPETWDFNYGDEYTAEVEDRIIEMLAPGYIHGLTLLGGDPFEPANQQCLINLVKRTKEEYPDKNIWAFTGFLYEDLLTEGTHPHTQITEEMLSYIDVLVDGRFEESLKDLRLRFRGSSNQRLIDMNKTREAGEVVLLELAERGK